MGKCSKCFPKNCVEPNKELLPQGWSPMTQLLIGTSVGLVTGVVAMSAGVFAVVAVGSGIVLLKVANFAGNKGNKDDNNTLINFEDENQYATAGFLGGLTIGAAALAGLNST